MAELLLPAGNINKLKTAFHFGADAVYFGGREFSLRAFADNFDADEIAEGVRYAHERNKRAYVTANIFAKNSDLSAAVDYFKFLSDVGADAAIITDPGLIYAAKKIAPDLALHLSTQANTLNKYAAKFWEDQGLKRIVLARELSVEEIVEIHGAAPGIELEAFVHGAMCMSYSGRCMLSSYYSGRSANMGECAQPCRWIYSVSEKRAAEPIEVTEDERGTYFMNSRDLCLINKLRELEAAGVCSFKIEGRMKSEFYVATTARAYRRAINEYTETGNISDVGKYLNELETVSHRPYTDGFVSGRDDSYISYGVGKTEEKYSFCGIITGCCTDEDKTAYAAGKGRLYEVEMRNRFKKGEILTVMTSEENKEFTVADIYMSDGSVTDDAKLVQHRYKIFIPLEVGTGDIIIKELSR